MSEILFDDGSVVHACEGDRLVPFDPGTFVLWTKCGRDVPANKGYRQAGGRVTCDLCLAPPQESRSATKGEKP